MPKKQLLGAIVAGAFAVILTFTPLPQQWRVPVLTVAWLVFAFASGAYVNETRRSVVLSPLKKRFRIDQLVGSGQSLIDLWINGRKPWIRSRIWKN
jgi:hypothetical protein